MPSQDLALLFTCLRSGIGASHMSPGKGPVICSEIEAYKQFNLVLPSTRLTCRGVGSKPAALQVRFHGNAGKSKVRTSPMGKIGEIRKVPNSLPQFLDFKLFGKTILVANIQFEPFWAVHSGSETKSKTKPIPYCK